MWTEHNFAWRQIQNLRIFTIGLLLGVLPWTARSQYLRIVNYNIEADTDGNTAPNSGLYTVLEAIGTQSVNNIARPIDILALEETTSNKATVAPIVSALNSYYGTSASYAMAGYQGTEYNNDPTTGDGPNALVYNTNTVTLVAATGVSNTPGKSGGNIVYRQVIRYQFQAVGTAAGTYFYIYVSHMKSGSASTASNANDRNAEAGYIRADAATLPTGTSVLYMGDFNMDGSTEAAYKTLVASGMGQAIDPLNVSNASQTWSSSVYKAILTESDTTLDYRDDIQFMTSDVYNATASAALRYVSGSYRAFGNNGTTAYRDSVNQTSNTALANLTGAITASQALSALTTASDHLPLIVDYAVTLTPYYTWRLQHFTSVELANTTVSGDLADPDGDGIANLMEYALNLDPKAADTTGLPTVGQMTVGGSQYLTLTYTRVIAATEITYTPQVSGDLQTWNGGTGYTVAVSSTNNADGATQTVVVRDAVAMSAGGRRFMRLLFSRP